MISRKELGYIGAWASKAPYPGDKYCEEAMIKLKNAFDLFNENFFNTKYSITFSNNEEIELEILSKNICHMLGIDYKNLSNEIFTNFRSEILELDNNTQLNSYMLLKAIITNYEKVINFDKTSDYLKAINYYKISVKSDILSKLGDLTSFKYACINFDKNEFLKNNEDKMFRANSNKFFYMQSEEAVSPYFMIGILQNSPQTYLHDEDDEIEIHNLPYVVETCIAPDNPRPFFQNQEVVIPTQVLKDTNKELSRFEATPSQKKELLKDYRNIITEYGIDNRINIYSDYLAMLSKEEHKSLILK